jgi:hypothetical protein
MASAQNARVNFNLNLGKNQRQLFSLQLVSIYWKYQQSILIQYILITSI